MRLFLEYESFGYLACRRDTEHVEEAHQLKTWSEPNGESVMKPLDRKRPVVQRQIRLCKNFLAGKIFLFRGVILQKYSIISLLDNCFVVKGKKQKKSKNFEKFFPIFHFFRKKIAGAVARTRAYAQGREAMGKTGRTGQGTRYDIQREPLVRHRRQADERGYSCFSSSPGSSSSFGK